MHFRFPYLYLWACFLALLAVAGTTARGQDADVFDDRALDNIRLIVETATTDLWPVSFDFETNDAIAEAFGNQMIDQVRQNLHGIAEISVPTDLIDPLLGNFTAMELAEAGVEFADSSRDEALVSADLAAAAAPYPSAPYQVAGSLSHLDGQVMEIALIVQGISESGVRAQTLILRADSSDWHQVAHAVSNALFSMITEQPGAFHSKILFAAQTQTPNGSQSHLALMDQTGGALTWIPEAGSHVAHPQFLGNRFEVAFVDHSRGGNALMHVNLLTNRVTPLAQLPDLQGAPSLALGGRLIAFASLEDDFETGDLAPTDIYVADVERAVLRPISIPGSIDLDPALSPDLRALSFVSIRETWSELLVAQLNEPMGKRDRTKGAAQVDPLNVDLVSLYGSPHALHQPVWSPDSGRLAFIERREGYDDALMIYDFSTAEVERIAEGSRLEDPTWGPAGHSLLVVLRTPNAQSGTLARIDLAQGKLRLLPVPYDADSPSWSPSANQNPY